MSRCIPALSLLLLFACEESSRLAPDASDGGLPDAPPEGSTDHSDGDAAQPDDGAAEHDAAETSPAFDGALEQSGTRLRARRLYSQDEAIAWLAIEDSALGVTCSYRRAADGHFYCMPRVPESYLGAPASYADPDCTQGAVLQASDCPAPPFHLVGDNRCQDSARVYRLGSPSAQVWYSREPEGCVPHALLSGQALYPFAEELAPSELVRGTLRRTAGTGLVREVLVGSDGSWFTRGPYHDGACEPLLMQAPDDLRCVPLAARAYHGQSSWFADASCSAAAAYAYRAQPSCEAPQRVLAQELEGMGCQVGGRQFRLFEPGAELIGAFERDVGDACAAVPASTLQGFSFYTVGRPIEPTSLARLHVGRSGASRIQAYAFQDAAGAELSHVNAHDTQLPVLFDAQLGTRCEPLRVADELLCAPPMALISYADANCQQPLLEVFEGQACPLEQPTLYGVRGSRTFSCGVGGPHASLELYRPGQPVPNPATRFIVFQGKCVRADSPAIRARYFQLGEQVPLDALARLREE